MADNNNGGNNVAIVVIFVLVLLAAGVAFFLWQGGYMGTTEKQDIKVDIKAPSLPAPSEAPTPSN